MMSRLCIAASLLALGLSVPAFAAPVTYDFVNDSQLSGDVVINDGFIVSGDFSVTAGTKTYTFDSASDYSVLGLTGDMDSSFTDAKGDIFYLDIELPRVGDEYVICSDATSCKTIIGTPIVSLLNPAGIGTPDTAVTGGDLAAVAPEPSSFVLLGTGIMSVAGVARRRFFNA